MFVMFMLEGVRLELREATEFLWLIQEMFTSRFAARQPSLEFDVLACRALLR